MAPQDYISKLPNELLLLVLERFANKRDLKSHSLVSRKFHGIARPLFYKECNIRYNKVIPLTKDVTTQPDLAKKVQVLNIVAYDTGTAPSAFETFCETLDETNDQSGFLARHAKGTFMRAAYDQLSNKVNASFKLFWLSRLFADCAEAHLALLLSVLPQLRILRIRFDWINDQETSFLQLALEKVAEARSAQPLQILGELRALNVEVPASMSPDYTFSPMAPLFGAPRLRMLSVSNLNSPRMLSDVLPSALAINSITIKASILDAVFLGAFIRSCPHLKALKVVCGGRIDNPNDWFKIVAAAIRTRAATLQVLSLTTQFLDDNAHMDARFDDMTEFAKLKYLKVPEHVLLGSPAHDALLLGNILPRSLEELYMTRCTPKLLESVKSIVSAGFLKLQKISAEFDRVATTIDDSVVALAESMVELRKRYQESMGVELRWTMTTLTSLIADAELDDFFEENIQG